MVTTQGNDSRHGCDVGCIGHTTRNNHVSFAKLLQSNGVIEKGQGGVAAVDDPCPVGKRVFMCIWAPGEWCGDAPRAPTRSSQCVRRRYG